MCFLPKFSRETKVVIEVLKEVADIHWLVAGLSVVAYVMEQIDQVAENKSQCVRLLRYSCALAKRIKHLKRHLPDENEKLNEGVHFIVKGSLMCLSQMRSREFSRIVFASVNAADLQNFEDQIRRTYPDLILAGVTALLEKIPDVLPPSKGDDPNAVGIEKAIDRVTGFLSVDTIDQSKRAVVIYGVGGAGKTTLAKSVFTRLDLKAYKFCRLFMDEDCSNQHLKQLQQQILLGLFGKNIALNDLVEGQEQLSKYFREAKQPLFMFIDNALKRRDLAQLLPADLSWLPQQTRILITTRRLDETDLILGADIQRYEHRVNELSQADSQKFLSKNALGNANSSFAEGLNLDEAVQMCGGIPLVLELVGSKMKKFVNNVSAFNRMVRDMKHALEKGERDMSEKVVDVVCNSLDADCKEAFLDIACFFHNKPRRVVAYIVGTVQLQALEDAALVKVWRDSEVEDMDVTGILGQDEHIQEADAKEGILKVHDIVRARGRRLSESERITDKESLVEALKDEHKLRAIKGIWLPYVDDCEVEVKAEHVDAMHKSLRVLNLHHSIQLNGRCERNFENLRFLNFSIRTFPMAIDFSKLQHLAYLNCEFLSPCTGNDVRELPVTLNVLHCKSELPINVLDKCDSLSSLEEIQFRGCKVNLSESFGKLQRLRFLTFADSSFSVLPKSFGQLKSLSVLNLTSCSSLSVLPESFGPNLCALQSLDMRKCSQLTTLPESFGNLCALQSLDLIQCSQLTTLPESFGNLCALQSLYLRKCSQLTTLPESFGNLCALQSLNLRKCSLLTTLPESFGNLCALQSLDLGKCSLLTTLPESFGNLCALQTLDLSKCSQLTTLPESFGNLCALQRLYLRKCSQLTTFPESFGNLCALQISNLKCSLLTTLPESFGNLCALQIFFLPKCSSLASLPQSFSQLSNLKELNMVGCERLSNLPDKFGQLRSLEYLNIESCTAMERLSADFGCLTSLTHLNAKRTCSQLVRVLVDALVEMKSCSVMLEINERHMMWKVKQVMEQHILVVVCESWERACAETMCTAVLHSGSRFLHLNNDGQLAELSPSQIAGTEDEVTLLLTMCDLSSSSNSLLLESVGEWTSGEMIYVEVGELKDESEERIRGTLLNLKRPWRKVYGWIPPRLKAEEEEGIVEATAACWFSNIMAVLT